MMTRRASGLVRAAGLLGLGLMLWTAAPATAAAAASTSAAAVEALAEAAAGAAQAQPAGQPPAARDEFVPVSELPEQEKLPAARFLIAAYSIVWIGMTFYVWTVWRRVTRVEQELSRVTGNSAARGR